MSNKLTNLFKSGHESEQLRESYRDEQEHKAMSFLLQKYVDMERNMTSETALARSVFNDIEEQALTILCVCIVNGKRSPLESMIGMISSALLSREIESSSVIAMHLCVAEFILSSPQIFPTSTAFFGGRKVESFFYDKNFASKKMFGMPSFNKPAKDHKNLGAFAWHNTNTEAIDKLNTYGLTVLDFEESMEPPKDTEDHVKWSVRKAFRSNFVKNKAQMFFAWNSDYRGRMYPSAYFFNPQGSEYEKNMFAFPEAEPAGLSGKFAVVYAIADAFGHGKLTNSDKLAWFDANQDSLDWKLAHDPTYARAQLLSLDMIKRTGTTNIPIELD